MKAKICGYGILKNYVGTPEKPYEYTAVNSKPLKDIFPELGIPQGMVMLVSVNDQQKSFDYIPQDGDDIRLIPPISGG
ncbi:MAG: MoaD/ThiS family protein [Planctomycetes bacterium]|nr:MoaD/ThiS family protein [Planctomycetota bacterium]